MAINKISKEDRIKGSLFGLAVGDALGAPIEFEPPGSFPPVTGFQNGGPYGLNAGEWTDDTSLALCLADSLISCKGFDPLDQITRYLRWYETGYLSVNDTIFDIGLTTREALHSFNKTGNPWSGPTHNRALGNGSLMRLCPVPLVYHHNPSLAIHLSGESSRTTHGNRQVIDACRYAGAIITGALIGESKETLTSPFYSPVPDYWNSFPLCPEIEDVASGSFLRKNPPKIQGKGYVVQSLEASLWALAKGKNFKESVLLAVNLGDDADTTGAICGQMAGAIYGLPGIPKPLIEGLVKADVILDFAEKLVLLSQN